VTDASGSTPDDGTICTGEDALLDAGPSYNSYAWSSGETSQTITAATAGTYVVTVSDGFGCTATDEVNITAFETPIAFLDCPEPEIKDCETRFNCNPTDLNPGTLPIVTGSFSGTAAPYVIGNGTPGTPSLLDFNAMPKDVELELIYTITTPDGCSNSTSCTFTVESKKANPGRF